MQIKYLNHSDLAGRRVRVYRNLHCKTQRLYSVQFYYHGVGWRVAGHDTVLFLKNVSFHVSDATRQRVIAQKKKIVHAYIYGTLLPIWLDFSDPGAEVTYNPYAHGYFYTLDKQEPVWQANYLSIDSDGVLIYR